jgi:hypothetical protein
VCPGIFWIRAGAVLSLEKGKSEKWGEEVREVQFFAGVFLLLWVGVGSEGLTSLVRLGS